MPPATQAVCAVTALGHGKPVLLDRPIAGDLAGAEQLAMAARTLQQLIETADTELLAGQ